jgi:hypothetical protein
MRHTTFIAYYTENSPYKEIAETKIIPSLNKFKLNYSVESVPNLGNWYNNTAYKPKFILDHLVDCPFPYNLVMLDVDCTIEKDPILFDEIPEEYDIALHYLDWKSWYGYKDSNIKELLTGTMMFRSRPKVKAMCKEWYEIANKTKEWEQKVLEKIIKNYDLKIYELPIEYIYINSLPRGEEPIVKCDPVIIHYQASREWKRKIQLWNMLKGKNNDKR